ncbi:MAG: phosphate ABC transporter ATP-binding protein [Elainellaceae cyanobacterium]
MSRLQKLGQRFLSKFKAQSQASASDPLASLGPKAIALQARHLTVAYGGNTVLEQVNLDIHARSLTSLIGPSGCGKSTLLRCFNRLNDLIPETRITGHLAISGYDLHQVNPLVLRRWVGMVFQRPNPFPKSIYDNIAVGLRVNRYQGNVDERVEASLQQVGLWEEVKDDLRKNALALSVGQQQRLCIARTIALGSQVLLMDEPCAALDPISSERINLLLEELKQTYTIVIVTHDLRQAASVSDWVAFFDVTYAPDGRRVGRLVEFGDVQTIFMQPHHPATQDYIYHQSYRPTMA